MIKLGKNIDGQINFCPKTFKEKIIIANPTDEILKYLFGYKDVIVPDELPEHNADTEYVVLKIVKEDANTITCEYEILPIEEEEVVEE